MQCGKRTLNECDEWARQHTSEIADFWKQFAFMSPPLTKLTSDVLVCYPPTIRANLCRLKDFLESKNHRVFVVGEYLRSLVHR
jgi:hypothetical protein